MRTVLGGDQDVRDIEPREFTRDLAERVIVGRKVGQLPLLIKEMMCRTQEQVCANDGPFGRSSLSNNYTFRGPLGLFAGLGPIPYGIFGRIW